MRLGPSDAMGCRPLMRPHRSARRARGGRRLVVSGRKTGNVVLALPAEPAAAGSRRPGRGRRRAGWALMLPNHAGTIGASTRRFIGALLAEGPDGPARRGVGIRSARRRPPPGGWRPWRPGSSGKPPTRRGHPGGVLPAPSGARAGQIRVRTTTFPRVLESLFDDLASGHSSEEAIGAKFEARPLVLFRDRDSQGQASIPRATERRHFS